MTAAEAMLVRQRVFALPSTNALVVPLSRDDTLVGLLVGEMPEGGGWRGGAERRAGRARKESGRARAKRRAAVGLPDIAGHVMSHRVQFNLRSEA